jgi:3-phytase/alkaline phosphatase D
MRARAILIALAALLVAAAPAAARGPRIDFLGQAIVPTGTTFGGTTVGGLSSITYDARHDVFYALSDDASVLQPTRFYTVGLDVRDGRLTDGDVSFKSVTTLLAPDGHPYPVSSLDPEGLALTRDRTLIFTSEGIQTAGVDPFVRRYSLTGQFLGDLPVPRPFQVMRDGSSGVRQNLGFESAGTSPDGRYVFTGTENALFQDGPAATIANGSPSRLMRYDLRDGRLDRQWVYNDGPVAEPPVPPTAFSVNGLVEILPLSDQFLITMERSFCVGAPGTGNKIKLYAVALPGATNVNGAFSIGDLRHVRPVRKTLVLDLDTLGIPLDNVEGLTFGPRLRDGRQSVVLVSDNNFAATQFTQFLAFAVGR